MRCVVLIALFPALALAQTEVEKLLAAQASRHADLRELRALEVRWEVRSHPHPDITHDGPPWLVLKWTPPQSDKLDLAGVPEEWRKPFTDTLGFWLRQELTQAPAGSVLAQLEQRSLAQDAGATVLSGQHPWIGPVRARFAPPWGLLAVLELPRFDAELRYRTIRMGAHHALEAREVHFKTIPVGEIRFRALRQVGGWVLPTRLELDLEETFQLEATSWTLSGVPTTPVPLDGERIKARLSALEEDFPRWSLAEKQRQLALLADLDCDESCAVLARRLRDPAHEVRRTAATTLGQLRRTAATPALIAALDANAGELETYRALCWALGEIADPEAIKPLSRTELTDKAGWQGFGMRAEALGKFRDKRAVDALMNMLVGMHHWRVEVVGELIYAPLRQATGQDFGKDVTAWRRWWKAHREAFSFPKRPS